jgi:phage baseplate assembly protein V
MRQLPAKGNRSVAAYCPRLFVGRNRAVIVVGPAARSVATDGRERATVARQGTPFTACRGTETPWTRGAGAAPTTSNNRRERALITIGRFRHIYGGSAVSCQDLRCRFATIQVRRVRMSHRNAVYKGVVVEPRDPKRRGRVRVSVPELDNEVWARRATLDAGHERGTWFVPDAGDEVLVAFENGDARKPIVIGALWGSTQKPPESKPDRTLVRTKHGATVILDDGIGGVEVSDLHGNVVKLTADGITVHSASRLTVRASIVELEAGTLKVNAAVSEFSGLVQCDALVTNSVVSPSFTTGAGNAP